VLALSCEDLADSLAKADGSSDDWSDYLACLFGYEERCHYWSLNATFRGQGDQDVVAKVVPYWVPEGEFVTFNSHLSYQGTTKWGELTAATLKFFLVNDGSGILNDYVSCGEVNRVPDGQTKDVIVRVGLTGNPTPHTYGSCSLSDSP
jgi:hypothetical protein